MSCWAALPCPLKWTISGLCSSSAWSRSSGRAANRGTKSNASRYSAARSLMPIWRISSSSWSFGRGHGIGGQKENLDLVHDSWWLRCDEGPRDEGLGEEHRSHHLTRRWIIKGFSCLKWRRAIAYQTAPAVEIHFEDRSTGSPLAILQTVEVSDPRLPRPGSGLPDAMSGTRSRHRERG